MSERTWGMVLVALVLAVCLVSGVCAAPWPPQPPAEWSVSDLGNGSAVLHWIQPDGVTESIVLRERGTDTVEVLRRTDLVSGAVDQVVDYQSGDCYRLTLFATSAPPRSYTTIVAETGCTAPVVARVFMPLIVAP